MHLVNLLKSKIAGLQMKNLKMHTMLPTFVDHYGNHHFLHIVAHFVSYTYMCIFTWAKKGMCVFQVSRPYLGFCPDPKHFVVKCEQNVVDFAGKWGKVY